MTFISTTLRMKIDAIYFFIMQISLINSKIQLSEHMKYFTNYLKFVELFIRKLNYGKICV